MRREPGPRAPVAIVAAVAEIEKLIVFERL